MSCSNPKIMHYVWRDLGSSRRRPNTITFQRFVAALAGCRPPTGFSSGRGRVIALMSDMTLRTVGRPEERAIMHDQMLHPIYHRRRSASEYLRERFSLNYAVGTLAKLATVGGGPRFVHAGRYPLYPEDELDAWALSRLSLLKASTSDAGGETTTVPEGGADQEARRQEEEKRRRAAEMIVAMLTDQVEDIPWLVELIGESDIQHTSIAKLLREHPANSAPTPSRHVPPPPSRPAQATPPRDGEILPPSPSHLDSANGQQELALVDDRSGGDQTRRSETAGSDGSVARRLNETAASR
jgi:hypothetical protein